MKLSAKTIDGIRLPQGKAEHFEFDDEIAGFFVRVRAGGSRTFGYQYRIGKQNRRLTLGTAVKEAFPDIRKRVLDLEAQVRLGNDPVAAKETSKVAAAETFEKIARRFLAEHAKGAKSSTYTETERYLLVVAKSLHSRPIASIVRRDVAEVLSAAAAERGDVTANRARSSLSSMFTWAMKEGLCEANPVIGTNKRDESSRNRTLVRVVDAETGAVDMSELVAVWKALDDSTFSDVVRLLMLTGQRRSEIGGLRWSEMDETYARITLPPERQKNGGGEDRLSHVVPLSQPARDILTRRHRIVGQPCVFGLSSKAGFTGWDRPKTALDEKLPDMPQWNLHDLRRSVATGMASLGVLPHVIESVLNHISGHKSGTAGIYNKATYEKEKRQALILWAEHLMAAVTGTSAKIVTLRA
jgi:integrase